MTFKRIWYRVTKARSTNKTDRASLSIVTVQEHRNYIEWDFDGKVHVLAMCWANAGYRIWCRLEDDDGYCKTIPHPVRAFEATVTPFRHRLITCRECHLMIARADIECGGVDLMWKPTEDDA